MARNFKIAFLSPCKMRKNTVCLMRSIIIEKNTGKNWKYKNQNWNV